MLHHWSLKLSLDSSSFSERYSKVKYGVMGLCKGRSRNVEGGHILCMAVGSNFVGVIATAEGLFHPHFSAVWIGSLATLCLSLFTTKNDLLFWQLQLSPELQLWRGFKGWCKISPLWQPCMGNATHVEYSNNWNLSLQRSLPLYKLIGHLTLWLPYRFTLVSETDCATHLPGSWSILPHWQSWEHSQGHYNCVVLEIFMPLMATGDSLTDV